MNYLTHLRGLLLSATASVMAFIAGCASSPSSAPTTGATSPLTRPIGRPHTVSISSARTISDYRLEAAQHLYEQNSHRIFQGKLPPMLYAIGVLQIEVNYQGEITSTHWMRAPSHAPEVVTEIERTVQLAAPFPIPARMGSVTYTDTWLWHSSGLFQLDTLTEGQL